MIDDSHELDLETKGCSWTGRARSREIPWRARFFGEITAQPSELFLGPNASLPGPDFSTLAAPPPGSLCNRPNYPLAGKWFVFDMLADGTICDGNSADRVDAFDIAFSLRIREDTFAGGVDLFPAQIATRLEDEDELVLGPVTTAGGLEISRKIQVDRQRDVARYLEIVRNPTIESKRLDLEIEGDLGSDELTILYVTESGASRVALGDHYAATLEWVEFDPTIGFVWDGVGADRADRLLFPPDNPGGFQYAWDDIRLESEELAVYAHYVLLSSSRDQQALRDELDGVVANPPLEGLSLEEMSGLRNFQTTSLANIVGAAGAMRPKGMILLNNLTSGGGAATFSHEDGSFDAFVEAAAGDEIAVRSATGGARQLYVAP